MLSGHEYGDHYMGDFMVRKWSPVAVRLAHEGTDHVRFVILTELDIK